MMTNYYNNYNIIIFAYYIMKDNAKYLQVISFNTPASKILLKNILDDLVNIYEDSNGKYFYAGNYDNIDCIENQLSIAKYKHHLKTTFRKNTNWDNMFNRTPNIVCNLLRWCFSIIDNTYPYPSTLVLIPKYRISLKKYYIPKSLYN